MSGAAGLRPGRIRVLTRYPLGLLQSWSWVEFDAACLVYPAPRGRRPLPVRQAGARGSGQRAEGPGSEDYAGFRPYAPGDSPCRIAWKAATRGGPLLVKRFTDQTRPEPGWTGHCSVTIRPKRAWGNCASGCSRPSRAREHRYGLRLPGVSIAPGQGEQQRRRCLEVLALYSGDGVKTTS